MSVDLPADSLPDLFPLASGITQVGAPNLIPRIREAFWTAHRAPRSSAHRLRRRDRRQRAAAPARPDRRAPGSVVTDHLKRGHTGSWYMVSPRLVEDVLTLTGFIIQGRDIHQQPFRESPDRTVRVRHYTITATRKEPVRSARRRNQPRRDSPLA